MGERFAPIHREIPMPEAEVVLAAYSRERGARSDGLVDQGWVDLSRLSGAAHCIERRTGLEGGEPAR